jgi:CBS domain-containing protein
MQKDLKVVTPTMTVAELCVNLIRHQVTGFPVVDQGHLVGVVSRTDVLQVLSSQTDIARTLSRDPSPHDSTQNDLVADPGELAESLRVEDIMNTDLVTVRSNDPLHNVADLMYRKQIHRIFVVENEELLGVVTPFDFVRLYSHDQIGAETRPCRTQDF